MLRVHRRRAGLTQRELGMIVGFVDDNEVSRHERSVTLPPLITALAYSAVFRVSVSVLFPAINTEVEQRINDNLAAFEQRLQGQSGKGHGAKQTAQKLTWLTERKAEV